MRREPWIGSAIAAASSVVRYEVLFPHTLKAHQGRTNTWSARYHRVCPGGEVETDFGGDERLTSNSTADGTTLLTADRPSAIPSASVRCPVPR